MKSSGRHLLQGRILRFVLGRDIVSSLRLKGSRHYSRIRFEISELERRRVLQSVTLRYWKDGEDDDENFGRSAAAAE